MVDSLTQGTTTRVRNQIAGYITRTLALAQANNSSADSDMDDDEDESD